MVPENRIQAQNRYFFFDPQMEFWSYMLTYIPEMDLHVVVVVVVASLLSSAPCDFLRVTLRKLTSRKMIFARACE